MEAEKLLEIAHQFELAFLLKTINNKTCIFCGELKRGYIHQDPCAFVDFANDIVMEELKQYDAEELKPYDAAGR